jgi:hypothetical protein
MGTAHRRVRESRGWGAKATHGIPRSTRAVVGDLPQPVTGERRAKLLLVRAPNCKIEVRVLARSTSEEQVERPTAGDGAWNLVGRQDLQNLEYDDVV